MFAGGITGATRRGWKAVPGDSGGNTSEVGPSGLGPAYCCAPCRKGRGPQISERSDACVAEQKPPSAGCGIEDGDREHPVTTVANLRLRKQQLMELLREDSDPHDREAVERLLTQVEIALSLLDGPSDGAAASES